ncbi:MAG: hypothetical protein HQL51_05950 [Magnetococcales bacterium]|nr:hypothetical protein [Magnetococcales bacterium]
MSHVPIPPWNVQGVLPPVNAPDSTSMDRSPYRVSLIELIERFATSDERRNILQGFLRYRAELHALGLTQGFQWVNGSFAEQVETLENRPPNDMDVVTFYVLPSDVLEEELVRLNPSLFDHDRMKQKFLVDSYYEPLSGMPPEYLIETSSYWYSLWSHRRTMAWKGFLQINLAPDEDEAANLELMNRMPSGAQP